MSAATNIFETLLLNAMRGVSATAPSAVYLALFLSSPTETGVAGTEVSYGGYARQPVVFNAPTADGTTVSIQNAGEIIFPMPTAAGGTVTHVALCDASVGGNVLIYNRLINPITLSSEVQPKFDIGSVQYSLIGGNVAQGFKMKILNYLRGQTISGFTSYFALYDGDPTSGGVELSGSGYARMEMIFDEPVEQVSGQMQMTNSNVVQSAMATTNWGNWAYGVIMDAETAGDRVWHKVNNNNNVFVMNYNARAILNAGAVKVALN